MAGKRPLFLDRDGVLNVDVTPYLARPDQLQIFPWTIPALKLLAPYFDFYVVSNQQGVALGITKAEDLETITEQIRSAGREEGVEFEKFYYCTYRDSENHPWRKPSPGMILSAAEEFGFDPAGAFLIGDKWSDIEAGARAGCRPLLVMTGVTTDDGHADWKYPPEMVFPTLLEAAEWIVSDIGAPQKG